MTKSERKISLTRGIYGHPYPLVVVHEVGEVVKVRLQCFAWLDVVAVLSLGLTGRYRF